MLTLIKNVVRDFIDDDCPTNAAALAYYAVFSLPAVLFLLIFVIGLAIDPATVQERMVTEFGGLFGEGGGRQIETMVQSAQARTSGGGIKVILSIAMLIFGASGAFMQLQKALNRAWEVKPDPKQGGVKRFIMKRVLSFGILITLAFLLLVSLAVSALLTAMGDFISARMGGIPEVVLMGLQFAISLAVIAALFAIIFKVLPDAETGWKDAWIGALVTAALFGLGKFLIGLYLGRSDPGNAFGAAGVLAVIMLWIYYSAMIVLLGAEFTQAWVRRKGAGIRPQRGAVRIRESAAAS
ncbi:MAG: YihY/virulence factor BrkB family protein [Gemmatimonadota bacterium]